MRESTLYLLVGLVLPNGASAFAPPTRQHHHRVSRRFMSDPGQPQQPPQQPQEQQAYDQYGNPVPAWNTAVDPASGNTYYYNVFTGETSWNPPGAPRPPPPPPQPQPQQQQAAAPKTLLGSQGGRRNPDADRVVNKADVYLAMLKQDSSTRAMARHYGDIEGSNQVFADPEIHKIKDMVLENPYLEKSKELVEASPEEMLPIIMLQNQEDEAQQLPEKVKKGPNYKERLAQMKNKKKGGGGQ